MGVSDWTEIQRKVAGIVYTDGWQSPCEHAGPVWIVKPDGVAHCTICQAIWMVP